MLHNVIVAILPALMIACAASDVMSLRIPNWMTGLVAALFFPAALLAGMPLPMIGWHVLTGAALLVMGFALFALRLCGGGDAKMLAAAGMWLGFSQAAPFLVVTALAGGVLALASWFQSLLQVHLDVNESAFSASMRKLKTDLPYGVAIAVGAIMVFPDTWWMQQAG